MKSTAMVQTITIDLARDVFQLVTMDEAGKVMESLRLKSAEFFRTGKIVRCCR